MKRRLVLLSGLTLAIAAALAAAAVVLRPAEPSVVTIQNLGDEPVELVVAMTNPGQFEWGGTLSPGQAVRRSARFSDNSFQVICRRGGEVRVLDRQGYVTNGLSYAVRITVRDCDKMQIEVEAQS